MPVEQTNAPIPMANHNSMTDFLMYQFAMGKSQEITTTGIITMMVLTNMGEIKRLSSRFFTWFQEQLVTWITAKLILLWGWICLKFDKSWNTCKDDDLCGFIDKSINKEDKNINCLARSDVVVVGCEETDNSNKGTSLNIDLNVIDNAAKSYTDLFAFVNYIIQSRTYIPYIDQVTRISSDKYSSVEQHTLRSPIQFDVDENISLIFNENLMTTVEISLHDPTAIKIQKVKILSKSTNRLSNIGKIVIKTGKEFDECNFFGLLAERYKENGKPNVFFNNLRISLSHSLPDGNGFLYAHEWSLAEYWTHIYHKRFCSKAQFAWFVLWILMKDGPEGLVNFLLMPYDSSKHLNLFGIDIYCHQDHLLDKDTSEAKHLFESVKRIDGKRLMKYLGGLQDNMYSYYEKHCNSTTSITSKKFLENFTSWIKDDTMFKEDTKQHSLIFNSSKYDANQLYNRSQEFLNSIRMEYYKFMKLPQAFKEVRVFTIKMNYSEQLITKINPEWEKWNKAEEDKKKALEEKQKENKKKDANADKDKTDTNGNKDGDGKNKDKEGNNDDNGKSNEENRDKDVNENDSGSGSDSDSGDELPHKNKNNKKALAKANKLRKKLLKNYGSGGNRDIHGLLGDEWDSYGNQNWMNRAYVNYKSNYVPPPQKEITMVKKVPDLEVKQVGQTYKPIDYLYMSSRDKKQLQAILSNFTTNSELYQKMGITHKLTALLYGSPGCGKSTAIRSIASFLQRDIYYLDLNGILANSHLQLIFDYLQTNCGGGGVVVMEDIDCMTDIVLARNSKGEIAQQTEQNTHKKQEEAKNEETLTLSYLLNLLDGTISIEDLVIIMTTNHPEVLDPALCRPGRIDTKIEFKSCDREMVVTIFESMFERKLDPEIASRIIENKFTPATIIFSFLPKLYQLDETDESILEPFITMSIPILVQRGTKTSLPILPNSDIVVDYKQ